VPPTSAGRLVTTDWVLVEVADALATPAQRPAFLALWEEIRDQPAIEIVAAQRPLLLRGLDLYAQRPDKAWSLTDCISFVVMTDRGLTEALTGDNHFRRGGSAPRRAVVALGLRWRSNCC